MKYGKLFMYGDFAVFRFFAVFALLSCFSSVGYCSSDVYCNVSDDLFQYSESIVTGEPFLLGRNMTFENAGNESGDVSVLLELWGVYDTDRDGNLYDEVGVVDAGGDIVNLPLNMSVGNISTEMYPFIVNLNFSVLSNTTQNVTIVWNTTIEPLNFYYETILFDDDAFDKWVISAPYYDGNVDYSFHLFLPTNFSINYTNITAVYPYFVDGQALSNSIYNSQRKEIFFEQFNITEEGITLGFDMVVGNSGSFTGAAYYGGDNVFNERQFIISSDMTHMVPKLPWIKHLPLNLLDDDVNDYFVTSMQLDNSSKKSYMQTFMNSPASYGDVYEWLMFDSNGTNYYTLRPIDIVYFSHENESYMSPLYEDYIGQMNWENISVSEEDGVYVYHADTTIEDVSVFLDMKLYLDPFQSYRTLLNVTNTDDVLHDYDFWYIDTPYLGRNFGTVSDVSYTYLSNTTTAVNSTDEILFNNSKHCVGIVDRFMYESAYYCSATGIDEAFVADLSDDVFLVPITNSSSAPLYTGSVSFALKFDMDVIEPGQSKDIELYIFSNHTNTLEEENETLFESVEKELMDYMFDRTVLDGFENMRLLRGNGDIATSLDVEISGNISSDNETIIYIDSREWRDVFADVITATIGSGMQISGIFLSFNGSSASVEDYSYNSSSGDISFFNLTLHEGVNNISVQSYGFHVIFQALNPSDRFYLDT
ncbi:MAG: hypothetical protein U9P44_00575, partial [archaeon]|nr:hypothetical protein [archaeon]